MSLFWYPALNIGEDVFSGKYDKSKLLSSYIRYYLARLQSMFKYENLPDSIPAKWLEHYLLCNGNALIAKVGDDLLAFTGGQCEVANAYYIPKGYIVANPWVKTEAGTLSKTYWIEDAVEHKADAVLIYNDTYSQGVIPLLTRYCSQLVENDITMGIADILARATLALSAADDNTRASAELWLNRLRNGELGVISDNSFMDETSLNVRDFQKVANVLTDLIEYHQYTKASLYNELGLNSNYNMKRESLNSNESQLNDDMLHPLIDNMLAERQAGIDRVNAMFGTDIKVSFNSAWLSNEVEEHAIETELESNAIIAEVSAIDTVTGGGTNDVTDDTDNSADNMDIGNDVTDDVTDVSFDDADTDTDTETDADDITSDDIEDAKEIIEDIDNALEDIADDVSDESDNEEDKEDDEKDN